MKTKPKIIIATGIYPPSIGGPSEYAYNLEQIWKKEGYEVNVKYFSLEKKLPTGIRHLFFLLKSIPAVMSSDFILVLDTLSVGFPTAILCKIFGKKYYLRTGGDFLWESYVERTKKKVLFRNFYETEVGNLNFKERTIFKFTKWILKSSEMIVFSTPWQKNIWTIPYEIEANKSIIIENYYGEKLAEEKFEKKVFVGSTRKLVFKNIETLIKVFDDGYLKNQEIILDIKPATHTEFINKIKKSYAVILVSLGDISPNMIMDAIRCNKPFIVTKEIGIVDRIKDIAIFVDPLNAEEIKEKVLWLSNDENYLNQVQKIRNFSFTHSWKSISEELMESFN